MISVHEIAQGAQPGCVRNQVLSNSQTSTYCVAQPNTQPAVVGLHCSSDTKFAIDSDRIGALFIGLDPLHQQRTRVAQRKAITPLSQAASQTDTLGQRKGSKDRKGWHDARYQQQYEHLAYPSFIYSYRIRAEVRTFGVSVS